MIKQSFHLFKSSLKKDKKKIFKLIGCVLGVELISIGLIYELNKVYGTLYDAIQSYQPSLIWHSIFLFCFGAGGLVLTNGFSGWFINKLSFAIRDGLHFYFTILKERQKGVINEAQRIHEDVKQFSNLSVGFFLSVFSAVIKLPLFVGVLSQLTHWWTGAIVFVFIAFGTWLTKVVSKRLILLQIQQESNEGYYRQALTSNAHEVEPSFVQIRYMFSHINNKIKHLSFVQSGLGQAFVLLPFLLLIPLYIAKTINLGGFFQSIHALSKVIDSLTLLIDSRQTIVDLATTINRLEVLENSQGHY